MKPIRENSLRVTVVAGSAKTIQGLLAYLSDAGVNSDALKQLPEPSAVEQLGDALVIFPDDFEPSTVLSTVESVQTLRPRVRLLLITSAPQRYQLRGTIDRVQPPILLPKPAFGWSILDTIRDLSAHDEEGP